MVAYKLRANPAVTLRRKARLRAPYLYVGLPPYLNIGLDLYCAHAYSYRHC